MRKPGKEEFYLRADGLKDHCSGGGRLHSTSNKNMGKWEFIDKEWGERFLQGNINGRGFWLNRPDRILAEGRPADQTSPGAWWGMRGLIRYR